MKKLILLSIIATNLLLANSSANRYGTTDSLHSSSSKSEMEEHLKEALSSKENFTKKIQEIVDFMDNFKMLSKKQREEAKQFQIYVNTHIKSIASCKNFQDEYEIDMKKGISKEEQELYEEEIQECEDDLSSNTLSYENAENFFNDALETLNQLKIKNKIAGKRYKRLQSSLNEANALVSYLNTASK
jgi:hypothetical protein